METALIRVYNDIMRAMDDGRVSVLVMLNLSAAFDTVDHGLLLDRLHMLLEYAPRHSRGSGLTWTTVINV